MKRPLVHPAWHASIHPVVNIWLIVLVTAATAAALIYWYRGQRTLLSARALALVLALRLAMTAMIFVCLLSPAVSWVRQRHSAGSIWLVVDHSQSMSIKDGKHSKRMELRWACSLGYLPSDIYRDSADRTAAWAEVLGQKLAIYQRDLDNGAAQSHSERRRLLTDLAWWQKTAAAQANTLQHLSGGRSAGQTLAAAAQAISHLETKLARKASSQALSPPDLSSLIAGVENAVKVAQHLGQSADKAFLARHGSDAAVILALNRVGQMNRAQLALAALTVKKAGYGKSLFRAISHQQLHVVSFAARAYPAGRASAGNLAAKLKGAMNPTGLATNTATALFTAASHMSSPDSSQVIVVSDGRQNMGPDPGPIARLLRARGAPTFALCIGSGFTSPRARIQAVNAPSWVFKHQKMRAVALIDLTDLANHPVKVSLYRNGTLVANRTLLATSAHTTRSVRFSDALDNPGVYHYQIRLGHIAGAMYHGPITRSFRVTVRRDKLQVLLIDNQPRWEYQYLVNYFSRSGRVHLQAVLLHPATIAGVAPPPPVRASPKNSLYTASALPRGNAGWAKFDLIILGDIPPTALPPADQQALAYTVETRGSALMLIAGQSYMPGAWGGSDLASLMPVYLKRVWAPSVLRRQERRGFRPGLSAEGAESDLSNLGMDRSQNAHLWRDMTRWYWHSAYTNARPNAQVLWVIGSGAAGPSGMTSRSHRNALLSTMTLGAGRVMYLASDQTWRMRSVDGHNLENAFLSQVLRWASGTQLPIGGKLVRFGTNQTHFRFGQTIHVRARILKANLLPESHLHFNVQARIIHDTQNAKRVGSLQSGPMIAAPGAPGFYDGVLTGLEPGTYSVTLKGNGVAAKLANDPTTVNHSEIIRIKAAKNLEMLDPSADPRALRRLASAGHGLMLQGPDFPVLAACLPPQKHILKSVQRAGLFTNPKNADTRMLHWLFLLIFVLLATCEWIIRKFKGLI